MKVPPHRTPNQVDEATWLTETLAAYGWRCVIAAALADLGRPARVPELRDHRWVRAKAQQRGRTPSGVNATLWGYLQEHTPQSSTTVNISVRREPFLFDKQEAGGWHLLKDWQDRDDEAAELWRLLKAGPQAATEPVQRYKVVTFHPSFSYEDFVRGIRPVANNEDGTTQFRMVDGVFKQICDEAHANPGQRYALFIDEINRVLEVLPKVDDAATSPDDCRGVMLRLLSRTERFVHFKHQATGQNLRRMPLLEVFIATFFDSVASLARGGLLRQYQPMEDELQVVRGRIDLGRQFGVHANRPERLTCHFDELRSDNAWNRALKRAIRCTRTWIRRADLHRRWIELMGVFDEVDDGRLTAAELERLRFNRQAERYRVAIDWARWILDLLAPSLRAGAQQAPALLFDMNKLFESAVAAQARQHLRGVQGLLVESQDSSCFLAMLINDDRREPAYRLRPDLVFKRGDATIAIADTKWKLLSLDRRGQMLPAEADVYQMHAYASAFGCSELQLIYPWHDGLAGARCSEVWLPALNTRPTVLRAICIDVYADELPLRLGAWVPAR